ncbi:polysaccharide deacetylase family protein [Azospirillum sp. sgz301742]
MSLGILVYHRIVPERVAAFHDVTETRLAAHFDALASLGVTARGATLRTPGGRDVLVSFDDATDGHWRAADLLEERGWRGVFLVPAGRLGEPGRLSAAAVADLARRGHVIGAHGLTHDRFDRMDAAALDHELAEPRRILSGLTGAPVVWLAPPGGLCPPGLTEAARAHGYTMVRGMRWGYADSESGESVGLLPALPVVGRATPAAVRRMAEGRAPIWLGRLKDAVKALVGEERWDALREGLR